MAQDFTLQHEIDWLTEIEATYAIDDRDDGVIRLQSVKIGDLVLTRSDATKAVGDSGVRDLEDRAASWWRDDSATTSKACPE